MIVTSSANHFYKKLIFLKITVNWIWLFQDKHYIIKMDIIMTKHHSIETL